MPEAGRTDYNELIRFTQLQPGEPYFFIRARDAVSGPAVRPWAALALQKGAPAALVESALQQADALDAWPEKHVPDADHLSAEEIKSLEYQLNRRAWTSRDDAAVRGAAISEPILLAERRGASAAESRIRNSDELLRLVMEAMAPILASKGGAETSPAVAKAQAVCAAAQRHLQTGDAAHG